MGRNWIPKYKVLCTKCGWRGTRGQICKKCPKCGHWYPVEVEPVVKFSRNR